MAASRALAALLAVVVLVVCSPAPRVLASDPSQLQDFCVADLMNPVIVNGFVCKNMKMVTANDFFLPGLNKPGMLNAQGSAVTAVTVRQGLWEAVVPAEDAAAAVIAKKDKPARAYLLGALSEDILLQVSSKKTAAELWASLKTRFVGADRVRAARLSTLHGEFDRLRMEDGDELDVYAGRISGMAARYAALGATLDDAAMVKKLLDTVPDRLYAAVAGIEQFCDVDKMPFEEALGRLKAFEERTRRRTQDSGGRGGDQLMLTAAQWEARKGERGGAGKKRSNFDIRKVRCYNCQDYGHYAKHCTVPRKEQAHLTAVDADDEPALL